MVTIRNANDLIQSLIDFLRVHQPDLDTKPGTVARDLFIEAPASQISLIYDELGKIADLQSLRLTSGNDLDFLAANYGITRKSATAAPGVALLTFASIPTAIPINKNSLIFSSNGISFAVQTGISVIPSFINLYKAVATRYRNELDFLGIEDEYAVEIPVIATTPGIVGNISKYGLNRTSISGVSNVTNISPFTGGTNQENDEAFRNRALAVFSGSNVGTALGYRNAVLADSDVSDALVITPGDSLMVRDGTQVVENADGTFTITSEGQGGKVDIIILGSRLSEYIDSFIYRDASNKNDPTDAANEFVLGQIVGDENKTVTRKRIDNLAAGMVPAQPVEEITEVTGSLSGSNFKLKSIDSLGRVSGNYELVPDTGVYKGSPWGFDKFKWISDRISDFQEDKIKGRFNGQDNVSFSDVLNVSSVQQNLSIQNENSTVVDGSARSMLQLLHAPCINATRVFNSTTGERYTVIDQNPDGEGIINESGRIVIAGNTLPSPSDILQVDYTWLVSYDPYIDFDGLYLNSPRTVDDSVDWGFSNAVRKEKVVFTKNSSSTFYTGTVTHPISSVVSVNKRSTSEASVAVVTSGIFLNKLSVVISGLLTEVVSVDSIVIDNTLKEIYRTAQADGSFSSVKVVTGGTVRYTCTIILPSDSIAQNGDTVSVVFDSSDIFTVNGLTGNFTSNSITVPIANYALGPSSFTAEVTYVANAPDMFSVKVSDFPLSRKGNGFSKSTFTPDLFSNGRLPLSKEFATVVDDGTDKYIKLSLSAQDFGLNASKVLMVIRVSDGDELWNAANAGTVSVDTDNSYILTFSGHNTPVAGDSVLVLYLPNDLVRVQPVTFASVILGLSLDTVEFDTETNEFVVKGLNVPNNISIKQASVIRISDGVELTDSTSELSSDGYVDGSDGYVDGYTNGNIILSSDVNLIGGERVVVVYFTSEVLKQSASRVAFALSDQVNNDGVMTVMGTTLTKVDAITFTAINDGLTQTVHDAIRTYLSLDSATTVDTNLELVRVAKLERVSMVGNEVVSVLNSYDVLGSKLANTMFYPNEMIEDTELDKLEFTLPASENNVTNELKIGDKLRITFYYATPNDTEDLYFTRNGTVYGNKSFALIDKVYVSSGFANGASGKVTCSFTNQPAFGSRYTVYYDYLAPKPNERILIRYNYNSLIGDSTINLEPSRPISADVLIKQAEQLRVNLNLAIIVKSEYATSATIVSQNVKDKVISAINTNQLSGILDSSDLSTVASTVDGVDRVRVTGFNVEGRTGLVLSITAQKNQYFSANTIDVVLEGR